MALSPQKSLRTRLALVTLAATLPAMAAAVFCISAYASHNLRAQSELRLEAAARDLADIAEAWDQRTTLILNTIASAPGMATMDPRTHQATLAQATAMYRTDAVLLTARLDGTSLARSDDEPNRNFADREWFRRAADGDPCTRQVLIGRARGKPALCVSSPIRDARGAVVGVAMVGTSLSSLAEQVHARRIGEGGAAFVVDSGGKVVACPEQAFVAPLQVLCADEAFRPILRSPRGGPSTCTLGGQRWLSYTCPVANGWTAVTMRRKMKPWAMRDGSRRSPGAPAPRAS